jgi:hypothetical protein
VERSDEQLVESVLEGNDEAFEVLFERHVADSLWHAREVLGSWGDAEEAVRHSFAAAHAYLETRGGETEFVPWLHTILGNHCLSMLQARAPSPARHADDANVVDLGEWRLRRKLFGIALPIAPSAALRDSVMAACGIGAGAGAAATAGVPLLGGTLASLAAVAVLAGGIGVAGHVAPDRVAAVDSGIRTPVERVAGVASEPRRVSHDRGGGGSRREPAGRSSDSRRVTRPKAETPGPGVRERDARRDRAAVERSPSESAPAMPVQAPSVPPLPGPITATPVAIPPPVDSTLQRVIDVVKAKLPATGAVTDVRLPDAVAPAPIGDDSGVTPTEPPAETGALPEQGTEAPPS